MGWKSDRNVSLWDTCETLQAFNRASPGSVLADESGMRTFKIAPISILQDKMRAVIFVCSSFIAFSATAGQLVKAGPEAPESSARILNQTFATLRQMDSVTGEALRLLIGQQTGVSNSIVRASLLRLQAATGQDPVLRSANCFGPAPESQQKGIQSARGTSQAPKLKQPRLERTIDGQTVTLSQVFCTGPNASQRNVMVQMSWTGSKREQFTWTASPAAFREAVGDAVALLNREVKCTGQINENGVLATLACENFSQGLNRSEHVAFHTFQYQAFRDPQLEVTADRMESLVVRKLCDSESPCLSLRVPLAGKVKIVEDRRLKLLPAVQVAAVQPLIATSLQVVPQKSELQPVVPPESALNGGPEHALQNEQLAMQSEPENRNNEPQKMEIANGQTQDLEKITKDQSVSREEVREEDSSEKNREGENTARGRRREVEQKSRQDQAGSLNQSSENAGPLEGRRSGPQDRSAIDIGSEL